jgi:hypothetical protein
MNKDQVGGMKDVAGKIPEQAGKLVGKGATGQGTSNQTPERREEERRRREGNVRT